VITTDGIKSCITQSVAIKVISVIGGIEDPTRTVVTEITVRRAASDGDLTVFFAPITVAKDRPVTDGTNASSVGSGIKSVGLGGCDISIEFADEAHISVGVEQLHCIANFVGDIGPLNNWRHVCG
jgi:hypothetical protein